MCGNKGTCSSKTFGGVSSFSCGTMSSSHPGQSSWKEAVNDTNPTTLIRECFQEIYHFWRSGFLTRLTAPDFSVLKNIRPQTAFRGDAAPRAIHFFLPRNGCDVTGIYLNSRDLHGSLAKELSELHALEHLELPDNNITGNLDVFKENAALRHLDLDNTRISGDLQSLAKATGLWHLRLRGTQVYGDVVALSNAKELQRLHLTETKVYGDLVALSNATFFTCLDLSETKVYGDLVALKNAKYLYFLDLSETKVHGDLACLANLTELGILKLSGPKVSGDFSVILKWKTIKDLGLSGTKVTSHPTEKWQHCCEHLKTLDLAWSKIHIVDGFLANFPLYNLREDKLDCPFSALTALDMTGTTLNTTVGKLLKPFLGCKELRIFKAAECSLTGPMPYKIMYGWIPEIQLAMSSKIDIWPLSQVLQLLDLSSNNVTKVEGLPGNCRAVSFRGNPQISFGEDVVKKATEHFVSLDLRNATFTHPTETRSSKNLSTFFSK